MLTEYYFREKNGLRLAASPQKGMALFAASPAGGQGTK